jgi:hypothetical protein
MFAHTVKFPVCPEDSKSSRLTQIVMLILILVLVQLLLALTLVLELFPVG